MVGGVGIGDFGPGAGSFAEAVGTAGAAVGAAGAAVGATVGTGGAAVGGTDVGGTDVGGNDLGGADVGGAGVCGVSDSSADGGGGCGTIVGTGARQGALASSSLTATDGLPTPLEVSAPLPSPFDSAARQGVSANSVFTGIKPL